VRCLQATANIPLVDLAERTVDSHGRRRSYTPKNYDEALSRRGEWLEERPDYRHGDEFYAVLWSGSYVPGFLKHFEVRVPVTSVPAVPPLEEVFGLTGTMAMREGQMRQKDRTGP
jgi:hypothetical protein